MCALTFTTQLLSILLTIVLPGVFFIVALKRGWLRALEKPIDRGIHFAGQPLFGPSKTWLGVLVYGAGATIVALVLNAGPFAGWVAPIFSGSPAHAALTGFALGLSYAAAELVNSFIKRRLRLESSSTTRGRWKPVQTFFDLADGVLAVVLVLLALGTDPVLAITTGVAGYLVHACTDVWMRHLRLKHAG